MDRIVVVGRLAVALWHCVAYAQSPWRRFRDLNMLCVVRPVDFKSLPEELHN